MTELLIHIYRFFRNHRAVCWLSIMALFAFFGYFASRIHLEEDINKLMPSSKNEDGTTKLAFADLKICWLRTKIQSLVTSSIILTKTCSPMLSTT